MKHVATLPIFDRLIDENVEQSSEHNLKKYISLDELKESIMRDLSLLMNTRVSSFWMGFPSALPYSYGISITAPNYAETVFEIQALENRATKVITMFEPRLKNVKVHIINYGVDPGKAFMQIDADVMLDEKRIPLSFPIVMELK